MELVQDRFYLTSSTAGAAAAGGTVVLSPVTASASCTRHLALPPYLSMRQITLLTGNETPPTDFWASCVEYEVRIRRVS